jgi:predicted secreted acid phosphatase
MTTITDKILYFLHNLYKLEEQEKISAISETLLSHIPYLEKEIKTHPNKPPLIIFDVDDTLLNTSKISKKFPLFDGIEPSILFYQYVRDLGYHTIILTARPESKREITIQNLQRYKVKDYDQIIFRNRDDPYSFGKYKLQQRKKLNDTYTIIANVGDQHSDFEGGYNGKIIQIPNF